MQSKMYRTNEYSNLPVFMASGCHNVSLQAELIFFYKLVVCY